MRMASLQPSAIINEITNPIDAIAVSFADIFKAETTDRPDVCRRLMAISLPANNPMNTQVVLMGIFEWRWFEYIIFEYITFKCNELYHLWDTRSGQDDGCQWRFLHIDILNIWHDMTW